MDHPHQLLQRLRLELAHGEEALVQPRAGACSQSFLEKNTKHIKALKNVPTRLGGLVRNQSLFAGGLTSDISRFRKRRLMELEGEGEVKADTS